MTKKSIIKMGIIGGMALSGELNAQMIGPATLNATGGFAVIGSNEYEWSVGEMTLVNTYTGTNLVVTQGVLQPVDGTASIQQQQITKNIVVYPNPASDVLNIQVVGNTGSALLTYSLVDAKGALQKSGSFSTENGKVTQQVDMSGLAPGSYILEFAGNEKGQEHGSVFRVEKMK